MSIPSFPNFSKIELSMKDEISSFDAAKNDGLSDFLFYNLYFFRDYYNYRISKTDFGIIITGQFEGDKFFMIPSGIIPYEWLKKALQSFGVLSFISPSLILQNKELFSNTEFELIEDKDNFDYLYLREDLASLSGKKFHKKKNHVNKFKKNYSDILVKPLTQDNASDALAVLDKWRSSNETSGDYTAAKECLEYIGKSDLVGIIIYVKDDPVAWTVAEIYDNESVAVVYFEKADIDYQGSFQYVNYAFANFLPENIKYINREQDLGKPGLIRAKKTYNPVAFVKKYSLNFKS